MMSLTIMTYSHTPQFSGIIVSELWEGLWLPGVIIAVGMG